MVKHREVALIQIKGTKLPKFLCGIFSDEVHEESWHKTEIVLFCGGPEGIWVEAFRECLKGLGFHKTIVL
jgi:hypothetical protein